MTSAGKIGLALLVAAILCFLYEMVPIFHGTSPGPITLAHTAITRESIRSLGTALSAFRADWGRNPPSRFTDEPYDLEAQGGAGLLAYYLQGPRGNGWGGERVQYAPFGGTASKPYGPYALLDSQGAPGKDERPAAFLDAFQPPKPILYFRAEPGRDPLFDVRDNAVDPRGEKGFASQEHFERLVRPAGSDGTRKWVRRDYLLISPGPDRLYGHAVGNPAAGGLRPARPGEADALCDDIANFSY